MPVGPYPTFDACVIDQMKKGHNKLSAQKICGTIEKKTKEDKMDEVTHDDDMMSPQMKKRMKKMMDLKKKKKEEKAKLGTGARFKALVRKLKGKKGIKDPAAVAAFIGRKKFGKKKFQQLSAKGRKKEEMDKLFSEIEVYLNSKNEIPESKKEEPKEESVLTEDFKVNFVESFNIIENEGKEDSLMIEFIAVQSGISGNGRKYPLNEINNQQLKGKKMFMDHIHNADNAVGIIQDSWMDGRKLKAKAQVMNTSKHPDIIEMIKKGLVDSVSIAAMGKSKKIKENGTVIDEISDLDIKTVDFVGISGIEKAKLDKIGG